METKSKILLIFKCFPILRTDENSLLILKIGRSKILIIFQAKINIFIVPIFFLTLEMGKKSSNRRQHFTNFEAKNDTFD